MNIFDILILGFLILGALQGYRKGLISGLVSLLGSLLGFYIAVKEYLNVLGWVEQHTPLRQWLEPVVYRFVLPSVQSQAQTTQQQAIDRIFSMIPKELQGLIGSGTVPDFQSYTQNMVKTITQNMAGVLTDNLMRILAFFVTYCAVVLILQILATIVLTPLAFFGGTVNRGGGFLFGALGALVGIAVIVGLISPFLTIFGENGSLALLQQAWFYPYLVQIFEGLKSIFRLELTQVNLPLNLMQGIGIAN
ncbi:CvpA family protein [Desulfitobacterium sp.]|uniref:CvpA family protein n=1 Tax=Desulfitobacterium sp. TaxID=49981 RepID=UPI002C8CAF8E|nr:CvpA family protein [Desulfitobacterium sp.]HVJ49129.1 CvpA family protein [Desulfitobacterium sp.]